MRFDQLPPEMHLRIIAFMPHPTLFNLCATSTQFRDLVLPVMYSHLHIQNLAGCLRLLRQLTTKTPEELELEPTSYIHRYRETVVAISILRIPATHEVKAAIALALGAAIDMAMFKNLKDLYWPFTYIRRGFLEEHDAAQFDEPVYAALEATYEHFDKLVVANASHVPDSSALWSFKSKCKVFSAPQPTQDHNSMPAWAVPGLL